MNVTINIPDSFRLLFTGDSIESEIKKNNALILYKQGKISLSKAAELSDVNLYEFIAECRKNEIPVIDYSDEELEEELTKISRRKMQ